MARARPIVFITDFGEDGFYAGILRAVAASASPASPLIDLSHQMHAHDIRQASFVLALALDYLPRDAVVVAVVDPGVGSARRALVAELDQRVAVLPDNGLLSDVLAALPATRIHEISGDAAQRVAGPHARGATFHGRDLFVPVAAGIARGAAPGDFGGPAGDGRPARRAQRVNRARAGDGDGTHDRPVREHTHRHPGRRGGAHAGRRRMPRVGGGC